MSTNYTVAPGQIFNYPADSSSEQIIRNAGGRSKLTEEQAKLVKFKTATEGQDCSDMPKGVLELYLSRGWVIDSSKKPVIEEEVWKDLGRPAEETPVPTPVPTPVVKEDVING